ncbi:unnamed protein product [Spirodela intermedia]|uniref:Calmodulin-binding domain-containing protein n=1 Tax=Spirodela intermedia TaxID=51605 RepID=A0A7I8JLS1_SPIIN|nr:unnamed protein product [Spirodela intermedia]CAA6671108.1 unnamed protein product [Spirodela intermedia]
MWRSPWPPRERTSSRKERAGRSSLSRATIQNPRPRPTRPSSSSSEKDVSPTSPRRTTAPNYLKPTFSSSRRPPRPPGPQKSLSVKKTAAADGRAPPLRSSSFNAPRQVKTTPLPSKATFFSERTTKRKVTSSALKSEIPSAEGKTRDKDSRPSSANPSAAAARRRRRRQMRRSSPARTRSRLSTSSTSTSSRRGGGEAPRREIWGEDDDRATEQQETDGGEDGEQKRMKPTVEDKAPGKEKGNEAAPPQGKKEVPPAYNDVIEETASKLAEKRKSKVLALVGAFETVISLDSGGQAQ